MRGVDTVCMYVLFIYFLIGGSPFRIVGTLNKVLFVKAAKYIPENKKG